MINEKPTIYEEPSIYAKRGVYAEPSIYCEAIPTPTDEIVIDGEHYKFVRIGNLYWTTENFRNATANSRLPTTQSRENGRLYRAYYFYEVEALLSNGWRIPTKTDFDVLKNLSTDSDDWIAASLGGNDTYGLNLSLPGYINYSGITVYDMQRCCLWTRTGRNSTSTYSVMFKPSTSVDYNDSSNGTDTYNALSAMTIRLCKDV